MTATVHVLAGAVIATTIKQPWLALPLAFLLHFVFDALPHYGYDRNVEDSHPPLDEVVVTFTDAVLAIALTIYLSLFVALPVPHWQVFMGMFLAYVPDLPWVFKYLYKKVLHERFVQNVFFHFHSWLQHEYPWGIIVEIAFLAGLTLYLVQVENI